MWIETRLTRFNPEHQPRLRTERNQPLFSELHPTGFLSDRDQRETKLHAQIHAPPLSDIPPLAGAADHLPELDSGLGGSHEHGRPPQHYDVLFWESDKVIHVIQHPLH